MAVAEVVARAGEPERVRGLRLGQTLGGRENTHRYSVFALETVPIPQHRPPWQQDSRRTAVVQLDPQAAAAALIEGERQRRRVRRGRLSGLASQLDHGATG